jgi:IS1 family transposase
MNMNRLSRTERARILSLLLEGMSMRAVSRITGASINTITRLLHDAGDACAAHHDETVRDVRAKRVQADEIWSFTYAKQANIEKAKKAPADAGDTWTWTALDADSKLIISWHVGSRNLGEAYTFIMDLAERLHGRVQLTTDGLAAYLSAVEDAFGADVDYSQLIKLYGSEPEAEKRYSPAKCLGAEPKPITGNPDPKHISTSYVERQNLTMRMSMRRFTRLTNAFSKNMRGHVAMLSLYFTFYNFCRIHKTLRVTPAMAAGLSNTLRDVEWIVELVEARDSKPRPRGPYKKRQSSN